MAQLLLATYGSQNLSSPISGFPVAIPGLKLVDSSDWVADTRINRSALNLLTNDQEINYQLDEITRLLDDGVFPHFGQAFLPVQSTPTANTSITFQIREGLGKIGNNAFHVIYQPDPQQSYDVTDDSGTYIPVTIPPNITPITIDVSQIPTNQFRRDLIILNNVGQILVVTGTTQTFMPADYSQVDAPINTIALYSILFSNITGIIQTPVINPVFNPVIIEGLDLIQNFADIFGNGIFPGVPENVPANQQNFTPSILGGLIYQVSAGAAVINGVRIEYGPAGNNITLPRAVTLVGNGTATPGATQGTNTNNWEFVDFTSTTSVGVNGTGNGNTQFLKYGGNTSIGGLIDPGTIIIYTASPVGEGGYSVQRPFDLNTITTPSPTAEYSIDVTTGLIRRNLPASPLRVYIAYSFHRNRRYLPYLTQFGQLLYLQSQDLYPVIPPEFAASGLPQNTIGLQSILLAANEVTLQPSGFGQDFRQYMLFKLVNGQITAQSLAPGSVGPGVIASGAINLPNMFAPGVVTQNALSPDLLASLSSSKVYARHSLAFQVNDATNQWSFADNQDAVNSFLTKTLTDVTGTSLKLLDAELQSPGDRAVVFRNVFLDSVSTEVQLDPTLSTNTFTVNPINVDFVLNTLDVFQLSAVKISFQDFGFSQVGDALLIINDPTTNTAVGQVQVPLATIKAAIQGQPTAFYKFVFPTPLNLGIGHTYKIQIAKTVPSDTVFIHTASQGPGRSLDIAFRAFYLPAPGRYGLIANTVQGYRIFDDFGDITQVNTDRAVQGRPSFYIPYASNITNISQEVVFSDVDSTTSNYIAVDVTRGLFVFTSGFEPTSAVLFTDHNILQGLANLSSERIHRWNGQTIESTLRTLETQLGSIRANITNGLERLYYVGKSEDGNGAKFRFSSRDRHLTTIGGDPLKLTDGNLTNPIDVIDNEFIVAEGREFSREIQDAVNATDVISFTARFPNLSIVALNLVTNGNSYQAIKIDLHKGPYSSGTLTEPPIISATLALNATSVGFNFFPIKANLTVGQEYLILPSLVGFTGGLGVRPQMLVDLQTGQIEYRQYFLPIAGKYGLPDGYAIFDAFGDLNLGSQARGTETDASQENFLDTDGWQIQQFFDENAQDPEMANTTFPAFSPSSPDRTGLVRFDIYFKSVPKQGDDGFDGVFRLMLHDSNDNAVIPANALPGNDYLIVPVPKVAGWYEIAFVASLQFGVSYHMHIWANGALINLFVGVQPITGAKAFREITGTRFIPFAADLSGDKWESFDIPSTKLVAVDVTTGRIKFNAQDISDSNAYFANFNLFTQTAFVQADTIVRATRGDTIEDSFISIQNVLGCTPPRTGIGNYRFNYRRVKLCDRLGRPLNMVDAELTAPYERVAITDSNTAGTATQITTNGLQNQYTFFIDNYASVAIPSIALYFDTIQKNYFDTIIAVTPTGSATPIATGLIPSRSLNTGRNEIVLQDVSGNPLNLTVQPNVQYTLNFTANVVGVGTAGKLSRNSNNNITAEIRFSPLSGGLYGTPDGVTINDDNGDLFRFNINRDNEIPPAIIFNTGSGLANLCLAHGTQRGIAVWQEQETIQAARYDLATGQLIDRSKLTIANVSGSPATQPAVTVYNDIAMIAWVQSGLIAGTRVFLNSSTPQSIDLNNYFLSDSSASGVANPSLAADYDRLLVAWEDTRDVVSGTASVTPNARNIFSFTFDRFTRSTQFTPSGQTLFGSPVRLNTTINTTGAKFKNPSVGMWQNKAVVVYQSDAHNVGISNDVFLAVYNLASGSLIRSDIRVDKAAVVPGTEQIDSIKPITKNYRNKFPITWLDDRDNLGVQHLPYGKIYDINSLTFDQSDVLLDDTISGIATLDLAVSEKLIVLGISDGLVAYGKRFDRGSLTAHDAVPFVENFDPGLSNVRSRSVPDANGKNVDLFTIDTSGNAIIHSRVEGFNFEPISVDLTNPAVLIRPGYIAIDAEIGSYSYAPGEEI